MLRRVWIISVSLLLAGAAADAGGPVFKLYIEEPGVYAVTHDELIGAGLDPGEVDSALVGISNRGEPVPIFVDDGGDGMFGGGDSIEFVAQRLASPGMFYHEYSKFNVYWLSFDGRAGRRMELRATGPSAADVESVPLVRHLHLEKDKLLIRVRAAEMKSLEDRDLWFWAKLTNTYDKSHRIRVSMEGLDAGTEARVDLRIGVRGLSRPRQVGGTKLAEHRLDLSINGTECGSWEWDGRTAHIIEIPGLDPSLFRDGPNVIKLTVPSRLREGENDPMVDVVMLNWVSLSYPHTGAFASGQLELQLSDIGLVDSKVDELVVQLTAPASSRIYTPDGARIDPYVVDETSRGEGRDRRLRFDIGGENTFVTSVGPLDTVGLIERDRPSELLDPANRSDYLMISHRRLIDAVTPLADFHRSRGLDVMVVDIEDVYDEFNHGIPHPEAIHDFVSYAYHSWTPPAPRFVLLVGDASWDTKNTTADDRNYADWAERDVELGGRFVRHDVPVYAEKTALNHRQLVPTWNYTTHEGHSASDNYFVAVDGDDFYPDLALGRFPVTEIEEVEAIVAKTIHYATESEVGAWRRNILWITNESEAFQKSSDMLSQQLAQRGFAASKVYPQSEEATNEAHQATLQQMFNEGQLIVHFVGHGGRHIWRTGPPDFTKNHDLFTLDHVAGLAPNERLAFVMSMTCYSAPFDHPNQDSIGEMFLRIPERGAVGFFGASWRNSPARSFSQALLDELTVPGTPVGEAIMRAKQKTQQRTLVETYNLLGDPAVALAVPSGRVDLVLDSEGDSVVVSGATDLDVSSGRGLIEWVDADLRPLHAEEIVLRGSEFRVTVEPNELPAAEEVSGVRTYLWNEDQGWDAIGWWPQVEDEEEPATKVVTADPKQRTMGTVGKSEDSEMAEGIPQ